MPNPAETMPVKHMRAPAIRAGSVASTWLVCAVLVTVHFAIFALGSRDPYDPDDFMRLAQVRDLLAGQSWWDVTQYRMDPPEGAPMHWSRLVDLPLAALALLFGLVTGPQQALFGASILVPMLYLCAGLFLLRAILLRLGFSGWQVLAGFALLALMPLVPAAFVPMRIDHHAPQAVLALACALALLHAPSRRAAMLGAVAAAAWLNISLEGLPVVALIAGLYGLRYVLLRETSLGWFLGALAIAAPALSLATRPASEFAAWCDILLPAHWAAFGAAAVLAMLATRLPAQDRLAGRFAALGLLPLVSGPLYFSLIDSCPVDPYATMDPLVRTWFLDMVGEGLPVWRQPVDMMAMALSLPLLIGAGLFAARRTGLAGGERLNGWCLFAALTGGVTLYGLWVLREMMVAQLLALPFVLALLGLALPRARAIGPMPLRVVATALVLVFVTPTGPSLLGRLATSELTGNPEVAAVASTPASACDFARLSSLPAGLVFTSYNAAPAILARTPHSVSSGPYHRNTAGLHDAISFFLADEGQARAIGHRKQADYLAICMGEESLGVFGEGRPDSMAHILSRGDAPDWLEPVEGFDEGSLRVYRVK